MYVRTGYYGEYEPLHLWNLPNFQAKSVDWWILLCQRKSQGKSQEQRLRMRFLPNIQEVRVERWSLLRQWQVTIDCSQQFCSISFEPFILVGFELTEHYGEPAIFHGSTEDCEQDVSKTHNHAEQLGLCAT